MSRRGQLRSEVIKRSLRSFIVPSIIRKYQVVAVRALWNSAERADDLIWGKRRELENLLLDNDKVAAFFSCITSMMQPKPKKRKRGYEEESGSEEDEEETLDAAPGIAFWVAFDWPEYALSAFEDEICKSFLQSGMNLLTCKAIKSRG